MVGRGHELVLETSDGSRTDHSGDFAHHWPPIINTAKPEIGSVEVPAGGIPPQGGTMVLRDVRNIPAKIIMLNHNVTINITTT